MLRHPVRRLCVEDMVQALHRSEAGENRDHASKLLLLFFPHDFHHTPLPFTRMEPDEDI